MSSAGLVYKYFGKEVLKNICSTEYKVELTEEELEKLHKKIYKSFILEIDAVDNGVNVAEKMSYYISTDLGNRVGRFNSPWNAPEGMYCQHKQFKKAMKICEEELMQRIHGIVCVFLPGRKMVETAWNNRESFHASKEFVKMDDYCPWRSHLLEIEREEELEGLIKFCFYQDQRKMWRLQALPAKEGGFSNRVSISKALRGLRGEELCKAAGVKDAEFIHAAGFIGGAWSLESAIKIAEMSVKEHNDEELEKDLEKKQKIE